MNFKLYSHLSAVRRGGGENGLCREGDRVKAIAAFTEADASKCRE